MYLQKVDTTRVTAPPGVALLLSGLVLVMGCERRDRVEAGSSIADADTTTTFVPVADPYSGSPPPSALTAENREAHYQEALDSVRGICTSASQASVDRVVPSGRLRVPDTFESSFFGHSFACEWAGSDGDATINLYLAPAVDWRKHATSGRSAIGRFPVMTSSPQWADLVIDVDDHPLVLDVSSVAQVQSARHLLEEVGAAFASYLSRICSVDVSAIFLGLPPEEAEHRRSRCP